MTLDKPTIQHLLHSIASKWNAGDLEGVCSHYAEHGVLILGTEVTHGRGAILDRYRRKIGRTRHTRGTLSFEIKECGSTEAMYAETAGWVLLRWTLRFKNRASHGFSSLTFTRAGETFVIMADHSWSVA